MSELRRDGGMLMSKRKKLTIGETYVYPYRGVVVLIRKGTFPKFTPPGEFYFFRPADGKNGLISLPVENLPNIAVRTPEPEEEVWRVLARLSEPPPGGDWRKRYVENHTYLNRGRLNDVAKVVRDYAAILNGGGELTEGEERLYGLARKNLVAEAVFVLKMDEAAVESKVAEKLAKVPGLRVSRAMPIQLR